MPHDTKLTGMPPIIEGIDSITPQEDICSNTETSAPSCSSWPGIQTAAMKLAAGPKGFPSSPQPIASKLYTCQRLESSLHRATRRLQRHHRHCSWCVHHPVGHVQHKRFNSVSCLLGLIGVIFAQCIFELDIIFGSDSFLSCALTRTFSGLG